MGSVQDDLADQRERQLDVQRARSRTSGTLDTFTLQIDWGDGTTWSMSTYANARHGQLQLHVHQYLDDWS